MLSATIKKNCEGRTFGGTPDNMQKKVLLETFFGYILTIFLLLLSADLSVAD